MEMSEYAVFCKGIKKGFDLEGSRRIEVLKDLALDIKNGELLILAGPSGGGKTTLLSIISMILNTDKGDIFIKGQDVTKMTMEERENFRKIHLGFVFQSYNLLDSLTVAENVAIPLLIQGMPMQKALKEVEYALIEIGIEHKMHEYTSLLSGGEMQRVAIARAIVHQPSIVICDEPTSALDYVTGMTVMSELKRISRDKNRSVLVVTHDHRIFKFADRIAKIEDGKILDIRSAEDEVDTVI